MLKQIGSAVLLRASWDREDVQGQKGCTPGTQRGQTRELAGEHSIQKGSSLLMATRSSDPLSGG